MAFCLKKTFLARRAFDSFELVWFFPANMFFLALEMEWIFCRVSFADIRLGRFVTTPKIKMWVTADDFVWSPQSSYFLWHVLNRCKGSARPQISQNWACHDTGPHVLLNQFSETSGPAELLVDPVVWDLRSRAPEASQNRDTGTACRLDYCHWSR